MGEVFKLNHCYNMDCLPAMELFPDNYFDLAVVDPPYFSGPERRGFYGSKVSKIGVHRDYPVSPAWSKPEPEYFKELFRVCRHYIVWGCNYFDYQFSTGRIVWDKCNGNSSFSDCEIAATNLFSTVRMFRYMWSGMMQGKSITEGDTMQGNKSLNEKRIHPTQVGKVFVIHVVALALIRPGGVYPTSNHENTSFLFRDVPDVNAGKMGRGCFVRCSPAKISGFVLSVQL